MSRRTVNLRVRALAALPLAVWLAACVAAVLAFAPASLTRFDEARREYNSGTLWAQAGENATAVLALRRAQRLVPGVIPSADHLALRIDENLSAVRARVAGGGDPALPEKVVDGRPGRDRALALLRVVPREVRVLTACAAAGLALAIGAARLLVRATGARGRRGAPAMWGCAAGAVVLGAWAAGDLVADRGDPEAVVVRGTLLREGPDDLTYPPAATEPLPPGAEVVVGATTPDGLWVRVRMRRAGSTGPEGWVPRSAIELVVPMVPPSEAETVER